MSAGLVSSRVNARKGRNGTSVSETRNERDYRSLIELRWITYP